jgi:hypothetical protein
MVSIHVTVQRTTISLPDDANVINTVQNEMPSFETIMSCSTDTVPEVLLEWEIV